MRVTGRADICRALGSVVDFELRFPEMCSTSLSWFGIHMSRACSSILVTQARSSREAQEYPLNPLRWSKEPLAEKEDIILVQTYILPGKFQVRGTSLWREGEMLADIVMGVTMLARETTTVGRGRWERSGDLRGGV